MPEHINIKTVGPPRSATTMLKTIDPFMKGAILKFNEAIVSSFITFL